MKVHTEGAFHIGFRQLSEGVYGVGFDRNIDNSDKNHFFSPSTSSWYESSFEGSLMIRPIYSTSYDSHLGIEEISSLSTTKPKVILFPNPVGDVLNIESDKLIESVRIIDFTGKIILETDSLRIDVGSLQSGMYFVQINNGQNLHKIIKK